MLSRRESIKSLVSCGIGCLIGGPAGAKEGARDQRFEEISIRAMGSELNVRWELSEANFVNVVQVRNEIKALLEKWNSILSDYDDESEVSNLSRPQNIGHWQNVSVELAEAVTRSKEWYDISQGTFDVTCGAVTALRRKRRLADAEEWKAAIQTIGWESVEWDAEKRAIKIIREGVKFDFGGIGKGLAVDKVCKLMEGLGLERFIVNFSGNLRAGKPPIDREGWPVEVESLGGSVSDVRDFYRFRLANLSMATSGDQFQSFPDWKSKSLQDRSSHIIDPQDGGGLIGRQAVTVFSDEASDADAAATAASVHLRRSNSGWLNQLSERKNGMFGLAQEIVDGKTTVLEFGGFSEKLKVERP